MAVLLETSVGELVIDLHVKRAPKACENFLKLCKVKAYNGVLFHSIQKDFIAQTGDPDGTGQGGSSIWGHLKGPKHRFFPDEISRRLRHNKKGTVSMANGGQKDSNGSQFFFTLRDSIDYLDDRHTIFGCISEGFDTLDKINAAFTDPNTHRPLANIRIRHTIILDDPFPDPPGLEVPDQSPVPKVDKQDADHLELDTPMEDEADSEALEEKLRKETAKSKAIVLEILEDLPDADIRPEDNVLFVCKLNAVTQDEDLELIFGRFGNIISCEIIRDRKTGDSLNYAFIEYDNPDSVYQAYCKMNNVLIDDRRIKVDFSQSVAKLWGRWNKGDRSMLQGNSDYMQRTLASNMNKDDKHGPRGAVVFEDSQGRRRDASSRNHQSSSSGRGSGRDHQSSSSSRRRDDHRSSMRKRSRSPTRRGSAFGRDNRHGDRRDRHRR